MGNSDHGSTCTHTASIAGRGNTDLESQVGERTGTAVCESQLVHHRPALLHHLAPHLVVLEV